MYGESKMSTDLQTERDAFIAFIDRRWGGDLNGTTLEDAVREFRQFQRELSDVQQKIQEALISSERGESGPLDDDRLEALFQRKDAQLRNEGIGD
jgi:hypothetical protein